jgi:hypothetical protein
MWPRMSEQESATHARHEDDALKREFRSELQRRWAARGEDWREPDMPDEDEPEADRALAGSADALLAGVADRDAIELRSDLARHLDRTAFPGTRAHLLTILEAHSAGQPLRDLVASLPAGTRIASLADLLAALGLPVEGTAPSN